MQKEKKYLTKFTNRIKTLNIIKYNIKKHTTSIILNGERLKAFTQRPRIRQGCHFHHFDST